MQKDKIKLSEMLIRKQEALNMTDKQFAQWIAERAEENGVPALSGGLIPSVGALQRWTNIEKEQLPNVYYFQVVARAFNMTMDELLDAITGNSEENKIALLKASTFEDFDTGRAVQFLLEQKPSTQKEILFLLLNNLLK